MSSSNSTEEKVEKELGAQSKTEWLNPEQAKDDPRISFNTELNSYVLTSTDATNNSHAAGSNQYVWNAEKKGWYSLHREDLVEQQQSIYAAKPTARNHINRISTKPHIRISESSVYVGNLPRDIEEQELGDYFSSKCGIILPDIQTGKPRIKIYRDKVTNEVKGDALITFFKPESVQLAIQLLHETEIRPGFLITVDKARFDPSQSHSRQNDDTKATTNSTSTGKQSGKKERISHDMKRKMELQHQLLQKHLGWEEENSRESAVKKAEKDAKTVILKHMFQPSDFHKDPALILDLKEEVRDECERLGQVTSITVFDTNPDGVVKIRFLERISAIACVKMMNGRFFDGRRVSAEIYDGVTRYKVAPVDNVAIIETSNNVSSSVDAKDEEMRRLDAFIEDIEAIPSGELGDEPTAKRQRIDK